MPLQSNTSILLYPIQLLMSSPQGRSIPKIDRGMIKGVSLRMMRTWISMAIIGHRMTLIHIENLIMIGGQNIVNLLHFVLSQSRTNILRSQNTMLIQGVTVINMSLHTGKEGMSGMIETITNTQVEVTPILANKMKRGRAIGMGSTIASQILTKEAALMSQSTRITTLKVASTWIDELNSRNLKIRLHHIEKWKDIADLHCNMTLGTTVGPAQKGQ